jgi:single-stranded-DNA-specific exonuclease
MESISTPTVCHSAEQSDEEYQLLSIQKHRKVMLKPQWAIVAQTRPASISEVLTLLLNNRCVDASFLNGTLKDLECHLVIRGMAEGAQLMAEHLARNHKVVLVGDYDCDGITSVAQMALFLRDIGYDNFVVVIPCRPEGYGVPERAISDHPDAGLFVAMDCGTADVGPIALARARGADCIVIDHHELPHGTAGAVAPANVLINPKQPGCPSPFKEFCSSGLTLLFLSELRRAVRKRLGEHCAPALGAKYLTLAAVGTVADVVPLVAGNRILTRAGLAQLNQGNALPLHQIAVAAGLSGKHLSAGHIGFTIAPRINAAGRIADPLLAYEMLVAEDPQTARELAQELNLLNSRRQQQEQSIMEVVRSRCSAGLAGKRTLVMGDPQWSGGLVGIVASRVQQELLYGPTILLAIDEARGIARGSARSVSGFDIHEALSRCSDLLLRWGGHKMAAGVTVALDQLKAFAERFEEVARGHPAETFVPSGKVDLELDLELVTPELLATLRQLEPHGSGNPTPVFAARQVKVTILKPFGKERNHLRLLLNSTVPAIFWKGVQHQRMMQWSDGERLDLIFQVEWDHFSARVVANIKDLGRFLP